MSSSLPDRDEEAARVRRTLDRSADDLVDQLRRSNSETPASRELDDIENIRDAFESVGGQADEDGEELPALPRFQGFSVHERVGQGGFGVVYRALDVKLDREVALKALLPEIQGDSGGAAHAKARARFLHEARLLARIRHPNVLQIHSVLEEDERIALVMELIDGAPLNEIIEEKGPLGASEAARAGVEVCRALAAVHAAGLVHRDVKTPNILRERGGRIVLADFGLGAFLAEGQDVETCGFVAGSPLFMAPEQVRGDKPHPRMDLYALGMVLYNLSCGKFPFTARSLPELFAKIKTGALVPLRDARPDLPEGFTQVVTKALAIEPESRYQSAGELEQALLACTGAPVPERSTSSNPSAHGGASRIPRAGKNRLGVRIAAIAIAAGLAAMLFFFLGPAGTIRVETTPLLNGRPIVDGDRVKVGDGVALRLQLSRPAFVYVIDQDDTGKATPLFPREDIPARNPLSPGRVHELPGGGSDWEVTSRGGAERIYVLASLEPLEALEKAMANNELTGELVTRSITSLKRRESSGQRGNEGPLEQLVEELKRSERFVEESKGLWIRKITLRNP